MGADAPTVYLAHASARRRAVRRAVSSQTGDAAKGPIRWLYLGRDYLQACEWEAALGAGFERLTIAPALQQTATELRRPFADWIVSIGRMGPGGVRWWASRLAERNTYVSPLFRHICYLRLAIAFLQSADPPALIVADSHAVIRAIAEHAAKRTRGRSRSRELLALFGWGLRFCAAWLLHLIRAVREQRDARRSGKPVVPFKRPAAYRVLMHCCIDEAALRQYGGSSDRYFTVLPDELRQRGCDVVVIPWLANLERSRLEAFRMLRQSAHGCLIPEDYYSASDYLWAAWNVVAQLGLARGPRSFAGLRVDVLLREAGRAAAVDTEITRFIRYARLVRTLQGRGIEFDVFLDKFENMVTEKPQVLALRAHMPNVKTVGFQHYLAPYPLQLHMFTTPDESVDAPHPDVIVYNSMFAADLFTREGFPAAKRRVGPSLRYLHLAQPIAAKVTPDTVVVMVPLDTGTAAEMLRKLLSAFPEPEGLTFILKAHPMMTEANWRRALGLRPLPPHVTRTASDMAECVRQASAAVVPSATTTGIELLLAGVPVVVMGRDSDLDLNPLSWFEDIAPTVHGAEELRTALRALMASPGESTARALNWAAQYRGQCLSPLNDQTIGAFLSR